jgi:methylmalonyl-CoA/ethylmalonyl-CoA epimerase
MLNKIYHLGYAVEDIEAASRFYRENFGVEPAGSEVVGEQGIIAVMFRVGESMVELVQPTDPDTPVGRFLARRGEGFHHVAYQVDDQPVPSLPGLEEVQVDGARIIGTLSGEVAPFVRAIASPSLDDLTIVVDCAHGAAAPPAPGSPQTPA